MGVTTMCNAYQHPPSCTCGFGGEGHLGQSGSTHWCAASPSKGVRVWAAESFCRPTTCPRCRATVYFVLHNGGSVWFDSLGKPWPKHGCFYDDPREARLRGKLITDQTGQFGVVERIEMMRISKRKNQVEVELELDPRGYVFSEEVKDRNGRKRTLNFHFPGGHTCPSRITYLVVVRCSDGKTVTTTCGFSAGLEHDGGVGTLVLLSKSWDGWTYINGTGKIVWNIRIVEVSSANNSVDNRP